MRFRITVEKKLFDGYANEKRNGFWREILVEAFPLTPPSPPSKALYDRAMLKEEINSVFKKIYLSVFC